MLYSYFSGAWKLYNKPKMLKIFSIRTSIFLKYFQLKKFIILQKLDCKLIFNKCMNISIVVLYFDTLRMGVSFVQFKAKKRKGEFSEKK